MLQKAHAWHIVLYSLSTCKTRRMLIKEREQTPAQNIVVDDLHDGCPKARCPSPLSSTKRFITYRGIPGSC